MNKIKNVGSPGVIIVQDQSGKTLPGIPVHLGTRHASTNMLGEALFLGVDDGEYEVRIDASGFRPVRKKVSVTPSVRSHQFVLQPFQVGGVRGKIRLACADIPLPGAEIRLTPVHPEETGADPVSLRTDWDGLFEGRNIPWGEYTCRIEAAHCKTAESRCRIGSEPCILDTRLDHVPEPVRLVVNVRTSDGSPVKKSRVRLIEGMGASIIAEQEGTDRHIFETLDRAPFGSFLPGEKRFCSPHFVASADVEGFHTGFAACNLRYSDECEVTVICNKKLSEPETILRLEGLKGSPVDIPIDESLKIEIHGTRKELILKAALPNPGQLRVTAGPNPYVTYLRILDSSMNLLGQAWNYANYPVESTVQTDSALVFIGVSGDVPDAPGLSSTLSVSCQPVIDPYEPNNTFDTALPIRFGEIIRPFLFPRNDTDFFAVDVNGPGVIRIRLKGCAVSTRVILQDTTGKELANTWNYANYDIDISFPVYDEGLYRVAVIPTDPSSFALTAGSLRVDFLSTGSVIADYQPDNVREMPLCFGKWTGGTLFPGRRVYKYRFTADINGLLRLSVWLPGCACSLAVKNDRGKLIYTTWNYANYPIVSEVPLAKAGTYVIEIRATDDTGASLLNFGMIACFYPNDEYEGFQGNEVQEKAPEIYFGQNTAGCIAVPGDTDIYSFYVDEPGLVILKTTPFPVSISVSVTNTRGRKIFNEWNYANYNLDKEFHVPEPGYYYIRIQCTDPNGYSPAAYGFVLDLQRIKPGFPIIGKIVSLPLNTGIKTDCLLPGRTIILNIPVPKPGIVRCGTVPPISSGLTVKDSSNTVLFNSWNYANYRLQSEHDLKTPASLTVSVQATSPDLWARQSYFIYATDSDIPPEPALSVEGIGDDNRNVLFQVSAIAAAGRSVTKYEMDFEGSGHFVSVRPGLNEYKYPKGGLYDPELKITDDRGAVGKESQFLDLEDVELNRLSCVVEYPKEGDVVTGPAQIFARCTNGPGKPVREMKLFLDNQQVSACSLSSIRYTPEWKTLGTGEHTVRVEARGVNGETAQETIRFRLHDVFNLWPENGSLVSGVRVVITWSSPAPGETIVEFRKKGDETWSSVRGTRGKEHRIVLENPESGVPLEFRAGNGEVFSEIRNISFFRGLAFERPRYGASIPRAYGQLLPVTVKNYSNEPQEIILQCLQPPNEDLLAGFIGEGSEDRPVHLKAGELRQFVLSLSAQDCVQELHRFQVRIRSKEGFSDQAEVEVRVKIPRVDLAWEEIENSPDTLSRKMRLVNKGDSLTDLSVKVTPAPAFRLRPKVEHMILEAGTSLDLWVDPVLFDGFEQAAGELSAESVHKSVTYPLNCTVPGGQKVYRVRIDPTFCELISSWYCTNRPFLQLVLQKMNYLECIVLGNKSNILEEILKKSAGKKSRYNKARFLEDIKTLEDAALKEQKYTPSQLVTIFRKIWYPSSRKEVKYLGISCEGDAFSILVPETDTIIKPGSWSVPPCSTIIEFMKKDENRDVDMDGRLVDMGHVFAGADAANHPTSIDLLLVKMRSNHEAATFAGDLGSVVIECMVNERPSVDQLDANPSIVGYYYSRHASKADMEGDIDSYSIRFPPGTSITDALKNYYSGFSQQNADRNFAKQIGFDGTREWSDTMENEVYAAGIAYAASKHRELLIELYGPTADNDVFGKIQQANLLIAIGKTTKIVVETFRKRLEKAK